MTYIEKIKVVENESRGNVLKKGFEIQCASVNLLVGTQGCGKSTLLKLIEQNHSDLLVTFSDSIMSDGIRTFYFDSEKDNPRVKDVRLYTDPRGISIGYGCSNAIASRYRSHGEVLQEIVIAPLLKAKDCVIFLDEPESGLSITNQFRLIDAIKVATQNRCQFFIATHCYPLIEKFDVISLEHHKQMKGVNFLKKLQCQ